MILSVAAPYCGRCRTSTSRLRWSQVYSVMSVSPESNCPLAFWSRNLRVRFPSASYW